MCWLPNADKQGDMRQEVQTPVGISYWVVRIPKWMFRSGEGRRVCREDRMGWAWGRETTVIGDTNKDAQRAEDAETPGDGLRLKLELFRGLSDRRLAQTR